MHLSHAIIVGVGGTGSHLLEPLAKLVLYHSSSSLNRPYEGPKLILVDGDRFEKKNKDRQLGYHKVERDKDGHKIDLWKAEVARSRILASEFRPDNVLAHSQYVDEITFGELVDSLANVTSLLVVLAVDNHATRRDIIRSLESKNMDRLLLISPGNDLAHGNLLIWARDGGKDITQSPLATDPDGNQAHPELHNPPDRIPGGCEEAAKSTPQLITANAWAAALTLNVIQSWLDDEPIPGEISYDCRKHKVRPDALVKLATARAAARSR